MSRSMDMGVVNSGWARFSRHVTIDVDYVVLGTGLVDTITREFPRERQGKEKARLGVSLESTTPPGVVGVFKDFSEPHKLWSLGAHLLVPKCCKNYILFSPNVLLGSCLCLPPSAAAW